MKFHEGSLVRQTPEEGRKTYQPKRCGNSNKDEGNSLKTFNDKNHQALSQKFRQLKETNMSIDLSTVKNLKIKKMEMPTEELYISAKLDFFSETKRDELRKRKELEVYLEREDKGQKCVSCRWVNTVKNDGDKMKLKSRLVVKGFEEDCLEEKPKYSPTIYKLSRRAVLSVITQHNWSVSMIEIKTVFFLSEEYEWNVYIRPPLEASTKKIGKLRKCIYGLTNHITVYKLFSFIRSINV